MAFRETHRTGGFENVGGYSRAVRAGTYVAVSGTAATDAEGRALSPGDVGGQTAEAFRRALDAIEALGGSTGDVILDPHLPRRRQRLGGRRWRCTTTSSPRWRRRTRLSS